MSPRLQLQAERFMQAGQYSDIDDVLDRAFTRLEDRERITEIRSKHAEADAQID